MSAPSFVGGVVILAAGRSRRFGSDKRAHRLADGRTLLEHSIIRYGSAFPHCIVVLRPDDPEAAAAATGASGNNATDRDDALLRIASGGHTGAPSSDGCAAPLFIRAPDADLGMGHSLAAGASAACDWDYLFVALADMPWVQSATLAALRATMEGRCTSTATIIQPVVDGRPGHPVGFSRAFFDALRQLRGDAGARAVVQANPSAVVRVEVNDPGILRDLDTPDQAGAD